MITTASRPPRDSNLTGEVARAIAQALNLYSSASSATTSTAARSPRCVSGSAFHRPTGQCSIVMSSMGKSVGLPVAK